MTRKDYELIAASIHRSLMVKNSSLLTPNTKTRIAATNALSLVTTDLAASLAHDNPRFDKARFLQACGF